MAILEKFTDEEAMQILDDSFAAGERGDREEEKRLIRLIPLDPALALAGRNTFGKEALLDEGFDLSLANEKFGEGWLDRNEEEY